MSLVKRHPIIPPLDTLSGDMPFRTERWQNTDGTNYWVVRAYNGTGSALTSGAPYLISYDGDEETNPSVIVPATNTGVVNYVVFATSAIAAASWGWFACKGNFQVLGDGSGTAIAKDDPLEVIDAGVALIVDAAFGTNTVAYATEATAAAAGAIRVSILGHRVSVQAS